MIILVDIGNTRTKCLFEESQLSTEHAIIENNKITDAWLNKHWGKATQIVIGSVKAGPLTELISTWGAANKINILFVESEQQRFGITNSYQEPKSLGVDRWLSLIGASIQYPKKGVVVIDAGTATTVDVLCEEGVHQGGLILAGIDLMLSQLTSNTSKVKFSISNTTTIGLGKSTSDCVNNAAWAATIGMINASIEEAEEAHQIKHCIILGGNAERILPFVKTKASTVEISNKLIFEGLKRYTV